MISNYMAMQNAILSRNMASTQMVQNSSAMLSSLNAGCQPIKPSFAQAADTLELQNKANETKVSVLQRLADAYEKCLGNSIKRSAPKYAGLDYKA